MPHPDPAAAREMASPFMVFFEALDVELLRRGASGAVFGEARPLFSAGLAVPAAVRRVLADRAVLAGFAEFGAGADGGAPEPWFALWLRFGRGWRSSGAGPDAAALLAFAGRCFPGRGALALPVGADPAA